VNRLDRFELEGQTYFQQGRKCGKPSCKCVQGQLHGPYWYHRDQVSGKVKYIGRSLPVEIAAARAAHDAMLSVMVKKRRRLLEQADALARLIGHKPLRDSDRATVTALGFGACLVSEPDLHSTQDSDNGRG
jgi:hypothetical protein